MTKHRLRIPSQLVLSVMVCSVCVAGQNSTHASQNAGATSRKQKPTLLSPPPANSGGQSPNDNRRMVALPAPNADPRSPGMVSADVEHMTVLQFHALADTSLVRYRGQSLTKSSFMQQRLKEFELQDRTRPVKPGQSFAMLPSFAMLKERFEQRQSSQLAEKNAQAQAVMDRLQNRIMQIEASASYLALARESADLNRRYVRSPATEQRQLRQRALDIHNQILRMEHTSE